jgi:hypothetical protein
MFNKRLSEISFIDVEAFCKEWPEGIRVEYKSQLIDNIPKTISAFANTQGGIVVIGVTTDKATNKVVFPIDGIDRVAGLEEKILQASLDGIYPGVAPEIRVFDVPSKPNKIVVLIKVHESAEAPHAIQNSTRVHIRTGSITKPYELAAMDRIEYFLKRRERPEKFRQEMIQWSEQRIADHVIFRDRPAITVITTRLFPREPLLSLEHVQEFVDVRVPLLGNSFLSEPKRISSGVLSASGHGSTYGELNYYGLVLTIQSLQLRDSQYDSQKKGIFINYADIAWTLARSLKLAQEFFQWTTYSGNLVVTVKFCNVFKRNLRYTADDRINEDFTCSEREFSLSEDTTTENLKDGFVSFICLFMKYILWAFNCEAKDLERKVLEVLQRDGLA